MELVGPDVWRLPLATPFEVEPVNAYLLRRREPLLIDCGPLTDDAWASLRAGLDALGTPPAVLRHIVITHSHLDHHGNLARLAREAPDAAIWVHDDDAHEVFEYAESIDEKTGGTLALARFWGFPPELLGMVEKIYKGFKKWGESLSRERWRPLRGEDAPIDAPGAALRALHAPGHTAGLICPLLEEEGGYLFANDFLLERITPNPTVYIPPYRGRRTGLADYIESLRRLRAVRAETILPGHGPAFGGLVRRVDEILEHHRERTEAIAKILTRAAEPRTVIDLALEYWKRLPPNEYYLACREMHGHLDLLAAEGRVAVEEVEGVGRFRTIG